MALCSRRDRDAGSPTAEQLLRVLEEHTVQRLGSKTSKKIDFRLITATNDDLEEQVREGKFREDLYYRVNVIPIFLPPLRERDGDIALLVEHFLRIYCAANRLPLKKIESEAMEILEENHWQGNVRELENLIQRMVLMTEGPVIAPKHLPQQILYSSAAKQEELLIPRVASILTKKWSALKLPIFKPALNRTKTARRPPPLNFLRIDRQRIHYLCRKHKLKSD